MLNILGEGSGAQGEQASEQLMARAMQVSSPSLLPAASYTLHLPVNIPRVQFGRQHQYTLYSHHSEVCLQDLLDTDSLVWC